MRRGQEGRNVVRGAGPFSSKTPYGCLGESPHLQARGGKSGKSSRRKRGAEGEALTWIGIDVAKKKIRCVCAAVERELDVHQRRGWHRRLRAEVARGESAA